MALQHFLSATKVNMGHMYTDGRNKSQFYLLGTIITLQVICVVKITKQGACSASYRVMVPYKETSPLPVVHCLYFEKL